MASHLRLNTPAGKVLSELRDGPKTIEEIATALRITPNAVRNQLSKLQDTYLATRSGSRPGTSKPSMLYAITIEGEIQFSTLYLPVLSQFLRVAEGACDGKQLASFMRKTGKSLAARYPKPEGSRKQRVDAAAKLLQSFGGISEVSRANGKFLIESAACPLAALTSEHPDACKILESFLAAYVGGTARNCCRQKPDPRCCFEVAP